MEQEKLNKLLKEICETGKALDNLSKNNKGSVTYQNNTVIKFIGQFKELIKEFFKQVGITNIMFKSMISYNQLYIGGMFKFKDNYYKIRGSSLWHCFEDHIQIEILPMCETYDSESQEISYKTIWRRTKYYLLKDNFEVLDTFKLPNPAKCKRFDIVSIKDKYRNIRKLAKITSVSVWGPVYYSVKYLDGKAGSNLISESRVIKIKNGI